MKRLIASAKITVMPNQVRLHERYIELICVGDQTDKTVRSLSQRAAKLTHQAWGDRPALVFVDLCQMGKSSFASREAAMAALKGIPFKQIAICAESVFLRSVAQLIARAAGLSNKIRIFPTKTVALVWLLDEANPPLD